MKVIISFHDGIRMMLLVTETEAKKVIKDYQQMKPVSITNIDNEIFAFDGGLIRLLTVSKVLEPQDWTRVFDRLVSNED